MPLEIVMRVFACYILPLFEYGLVLWITGKFSASTEQVINATFTKFMKRYLNVPWCTANSIVYFMTNTLPLMTLLKQLSHKRINIYLPKCMTDIQLTFFNNLSRDHDLTNEKILSQIPSHFWRSRAISRLPADQKFRKTLCREVCDTSHHECCLIKSFHPSSTEDCVCQFFGNNLHAYHISYYLQQVLIFSNCD